MREIKFRVWDLENKKWADSIAGLTMDIENGSILENEARIYRYKHIVMQFTGLKDKNGKEIYEGDIVTYTGDSVEPGIFQIGFDYGCFGYFNEEQDFVEFDMDRYVGDGTEKQHSVNKHPSFEVIGNIYENPGLLKIT